MQSNLFFNTAAYIRLSHHDRRLLHQDVKKMDDSNSVKNQKQLIKSYIQSHMDLKFIQEYVDDGYSGVDFNRPAFERLIEDVIAKKINCIVVKDLSRLGRNLTLVGKYLEEIFPALEVRFIAIDQYDSFKSNHSRDGLVVPMINLMNDYFSRSTSVKVRDVNMKKFENGDNIAAFTPFGYKKNERNRFQLEIDQDAARTVKRIFSMSIDGMTNIKIADQLNKEGIPSPYMYKKKNGENYYTGFQLNDISKWSALAIRRILTNNVYIGTLEQGKTYNLNYKYKKRIPRQYKDWYRHENAHKAIISKNEFDMVQRVLSFESKTSAKGDLVYLFSGMLFCSECGSHLYRKKKKIDDTTYVYYGCYDKNKKLKHPVSIREDILEMVILKLIKKHINLMVEFAELSKDLDNESVIHIEMNGINQLLLDKNREIERYKNLKLRLYEDYHEKVISKKEYDDFSVIYDRREKLAFHHVSELLIRKERLSKYVAEEWTDRFQEFIDADKMSRRLLLSLIEKITIYPNKGVKVDFCFENEFHILKNVIPSFLERGKLCQNM